MSACNSRCLDCPYDFFVPETPLRRPTRAAQRSEWKQDALFELEDLRELYPDLPEVRL